MPEVKMTNICPKICPKSVPKSVPKRVPEWKQPKARTPEILQSGQKSYKLVYVQRSLLSWAASPPLNRSAGWLGLLFF